MTTALNPKFSFETLVMGAANRLAVTAGRAVAENPAAAYNPLFVYSGSGLGKTHLLMAIGQGAKKLLPHLTIEYLTLDDYVEAFHAAVAAGQGDAFRRRFQNVDLLLVDDVQFLANRQEMQAELLRLTEALQTAGHQIVLTSDRPPAEIADLDERLISRFSGGLVVDIGSPDYETRVAILRRKADERGARFQPGVLEAAASSEFHNVRELLGVLNRLIAHQAVHDAPLTPDGVRSLLGHARTDASPPTTPGAGPASGGAAGAGGDEFGAFLRDVAVTVGKAVESWRARVAEAVMRFEGEGYRTGRLEALLQADAPPSVDDAIAQFGADVDRLKELETEVAALDPQAAGKSVFRDPERLADALAVLEQVRAGAAPPPAPSAAFPLATLVEGPSNERAVSAVRTVIEQPGSRYNPLVLTGPSGVGKTHLLNALGLALAEADRAGIVACLSAQAFIDELIAAIEGSRVEWWRARYRRVTALLIDDIHLIAGKDRSQEELFNLFNRLYDDERQLVFTAPEPPGELLNVEPRLISRLEGGLVVALEPPDRAVRRTAAERLLAEHGATPDVALLDYFADRPADSVRELAALVQRVLSETAVRDQPLSAGLARDVLEGQPAEPGRRTSGFRTSGIVVSSLGGIRSREKMAWDWPDLGDRLIEELR